tara:strand:- start:5430 stop:6194 length:765 start_codon:yes stop_codon:yes gene_type:complete
MIGIFDSGVGGLSLLNAVQRVYPFEDCLYISDNKHAPYGEKKVSFILERCRKHIEFFIEQGARIIIIACNTATTIAIKSLRKEFDLPFIGIEPAIKPAITISTSSKIGVIATRATLSSSLYNTTKGKYANPESVVEVIGEGFVEAVESGSIQSKSFQEQLRETIFFFKRHEVRYVVLGCTHYFFLKDEFERIAGDTMKFIEPTEAIINRLQAIYGENRMSSSKQAKTSIYCSGAGDAVLRILKGQKFRLLQLDY